MFIPLYLGYLFRSEYFREKILEQCSEALGLVIDQELNNVTIKGKEGLISTSESKIPVVVIPTDEEVMIARDVVSLVKPK